MEQGKPLVTATATAVAVPASGVPTVTATATAVAVPMPAAAVPAAHHGHIQPVNVVHPTNKWSSDVFDCSQDCCIFGATCCCGFITAGQLYEKVIGPQGMCLKIFVMLLVLYILAQGFQNAQQQVQRMVGWKEALPLTAVSWGCWIFYLAILTSVLVIVRKKVREVDQIPPQCCGEAEDCCCSWWCPPCTMAQMFRHFGNRQGYYSLSTPTGDLRGYTPWPAATAAV